MTINENRKCTGCHSDLDIWNGTNIVGGVDFHLSCGYGEFSDTLSMNVNLCHNCSVKLFKIIDPDFNLWDSHPTFHQSKDERCCRWAWLPKNDPVNM
jgi:hypothetical protein